MSIQFIQESNFRGFKRYVLSIGNTIISFLALILLFSILYLTISATRTSVVAINDYKTETVLDVYRTDLYELEKIILSMQKDVFSVDQSSMQEKFRSARYQYKQIEYLVDYFFRETALKLNGPNLLEAKPSTPNQPIYPTGFQVLEEALFTEENYDPKKIKSELDGIQFGIERLIKNHTEIELTNSTILHALKLNIYRLISKGITGFDSPVALNSLNEAKSTLQSTKKISQLLSQGEKITAACDSSLSFLEKDSITFENLDRASFIKNYLNPLCDAIHHYQISLGVSFQDSENLAIHPEASNLFSENAFNSSYFAPADAYLNKPEIELLGELLFNDKSLSLDNSRSCATCHDPNKAFTDGVRFNTILNSEGKLTRNTPTIINAAFQNVQFMDGRITFLEDQAHAVITNKQEMSGELKLIVQRLNTNKSYSKKFKSIFNTKSITERQLKLIIASYVRSIVSFNSRFDLYMRGDENQLTSNEKNGFNLFAGKAKCATCHFIPLFNGVVPPFFDKTESEVLGVPNQIEKMNAELDKDLGKYLTYSIPHQKYSFKTGTIRNSEFTAPYMHNGVFESLEEVIDFYDLGGGAGYGFDLENQTLPGDELKLSKQEKLDLVAFLKSLSEEKFRPTTSTQKLH